MTTNAVPAVAEPRRYRHATAVAPEDMDGSAVALLNSGGQRPVLALECPAGEVLAMLDVERGAIRRQLAAGEPVVVLTNTHQDQITARDQLAKLVPDGWTVRV